MGGKRNGPGQEPVSRSWELEATFAEARWSMEFKCDLETVRRRYRWLAPIYPLFELLLWLPSGIRGRAVERLKLASGERVGTIENGDTGSTGPLSFSPTAY